MTTKDYYPPYPHSFSVGDRVTRRPGTLGNMDGHGPVGTVEALERVGAHCMVKVAFISHTETFAADTYVPAYRGMEPGMREAADAGSLATGSRKMSDAAIVGFTEILNSTPSQ